jgi:V8-like Glu-specific endopeptidase
MNKFAAFVFIIALLLFCNPLLAEDVVTPFVENSGYGCLQDEYGTAVVRIHSDGDYSLRRFSSMINRTRTGVLNLRARLRWLRAVRASATKIANAQERLRNKRSFLTALRQCKDGVPPGQSPVSPSPDSDVPCAVVGNLAGATSRIINGTTCTVGNSPVVELELIIGGKSQGSCSGTALTKRAVLTAAHCLTDGVSAIKVHSNSTTIQASSFHYHPGYDSSNDEAYDVGVVLLGQDLPTRTMSIVPMNTSYVAGEQAIIAGFGLDERGKSGVLKAGTMTLTSATSTGIMSYFNGNGSNSCSGDSGGPYLVKRNGSWLIAGTTSWGIKENCSAGDQSYFANIANESHQNFIRQYVSGL